MRMDPSRSVRSLMQQATLFVLLVGTAHYTAIPLKNGRR
jgi:hypothetical protein